MEPKHQSQFCVVSCMSSFSLCYSHTSVTQHVGSSIPSVSCIPHGNVHIGTGTHPDFSPFPQLFCSSNLVYRKATYCLANAYGCFLHQKRWRRAISAILRARSVAEPRQQLTPWNREKRRLGDSSNKELFRCRCR